jgi:hypothetical protein
MLFTTLVYCRHNTGGGIGVCLNLKVPYPRPSVFTHEEQRLYLELKQKFSDMAPASAEDMKQLNFLNVSCFLTVH